MMCFQPIILTYSVPEGLNISVFLLYSAFTIVYCAIYPDFADMLHFVNGIFVYKLHNLFVHLYWT